VTQADLGGGDWPPPALSSPLMAVLPPVSRPSVALRDLVAFLRQRSREQVIAAILAVLVTIIIVIIFLVDSKINTAPPPQIIYVEQWPANRTDEQIKADQKKDQAAREAALKERQRQFQKLEKQLGIE
jgi:ABC-type Na+ efflux pump permease subunit